jgi:hypothetical protein
MNAFGEFGKNIAPIADVIGAEGAVGIFTGATDEVDGGG